MTLSSHFLNQPEALKEQVLRDLNHRARSGIYIYPVVWFITMLWADVPNTHSSLFIMGTLGLSFFTGLRAWAYWICRDGNQSLSYDIKYILLVFAVLSSALFWGVITACVILLIDIYYMSQFYMVLAPAFAIGGAAAINISTHVRMVYPTLIFFPSLCLGVIIDYDQYPLLMLMVFVAMIYIIDLSRSAHRDYWQAVENLHVAKERAKRLEQLSTTDPLTLLPNRLFFNIEFERLYREALDKQQCLSLLMIDLDHFKRINDTHGHLNGDHCLKQVAQLLDQSLIGTEATLSRYGGEEFVALLPNTPESEACNIARIMLQNCQFTPVNVNGEKLNITCSIGVTSCVPRNMNRQSDLISAADNALYSAKKNGRNCWQYASIPSPVLTTVASNSNV